MRHPSYHGFLPARHLAVLAALLLACCTTKVNQRGYVDAQQNIPKVKIGESKKQDVFALLGSPSTVSDFGDETWYYIAARQESWGFMKPKLEEQDVTEITFGGDDVVIKVAQRGLKDRQKVAIASEVTPTEGHKLGFAEQILGNVGRFNKNQKQVAR